MSQVSHATWQHHGTQTTHQTADWLFGKIRTKKKIEKLVHDIKNDKTQKITEQLFGKRQDRIQTTYQLLLKTDEKEFLNIVNEKEILNIVNEKEYVATHKSEDQLFEKNDHLGGENVWIFNEKVYENSILIEKTETKESLENNNKSDVYNTSLNNGNIVSKENNNENKVGGKSDVTKKAVDETNLLILDNAINKAILNEKDINTNANEINDKKVKNTANIFHNEVNLILETDKSNKDNIFETTISTTEFKEQEYKGVDLKGSPRKQLFNKRRSNRGSNGINWNLKSVLIYFLVINILGVNCTDDESNYSSGLTTRMIASFLGYGRSCSVNGVARACTLTLTCWLSGGTRLKGCGGWLYSCCTGPWEYDNSISSSEWKYKVSPPKLRLAVPQRTMPNNVFRRRVDEDVSQMECGLPSSSLFQKRIIGGRQARFAEFPWQAHVRISEFQCGGVLVSRMFVATAAHCVSRAPVRDIVVWLGAVDTGDTQPATKMGIIQKILHPLFQFRMTQPDRYDIALLKFTHPVSYSNSILPICLPAYGLELRGRNGVIAGWGKTDATSGHTGTNLLRSATVPILSKEQCINWHQSKQISVEIHSEMICAGHSDGHQDACLGDSGGPLIVLDGGRYFLVGITSAGFGCGVDHQPGIYHNVKITAQWIKRVIMNTY